MGEFSRYRVILNGKLIPEHERVEVLQGLAALFNSRTSMMESLLQGKDTPLKKEYSKNQATIISQKIRKAGAECRIEEIPEIELGLVDDHLSEQIGPGKCPSCQYQLKTAVMKCPGCGYSNIAENSADNVKQPGSKRYQNQEGVNAKPGTSSETRPHDYESSAENNPREKKLQTMMMRFVRSNTNYYRHQFSKFGSPETPSFKVTWHWPAFFFFFFWALYRKMWVLGAIHMAGGIGLMLWIKPGLVYLVWVLLWPIAANYLYFRRAANHARSALSNPAVEQRFLDQGDVSRGAVWIGVLIAMVLSVMTSNMVASRFLEQYGDQIKDVLPGSGSQTRGDGSVLENSEKNTSLTKTSLVLSGLGTSLKILLIVDEGNNNKQAIKNYLDKITNGLAKDAWGTQIQVVLHVDRYVFVSAGPDRTFKTDDDILQPVVIP